MGISNRCLSLGSWVLSRVERRGSSGEKVRARVRRESARQICLIIK